MIKNLAVAAGLLALATGVAHAQEGDEAPALDTSVPFLCATNTAVICSDLVGCSTTPLALLGAPAFFKVDVEGKSLTSWGPESSDNSSDLENIDRIDGNLIIQGIDDGIDDVRDGVGWTMHISEINGRFSASAPLDDSAIVIFGACTGL